MSRKISMHNRVFVFSSIQLHKHLFSTIGYLAHMRHCASEMQFVLPKSLYSGKGNRHINQ